MRTRTCREKCSLGAPWSWDDRSWPTFPSSHRPPEKRISLGTMGHHKTPHYGISPRDGSRRGFINPFFPTVPTCAVRETASLGLHMLELSCENATVDKNGLIEPPMMPERDTSLSDSFTPDCCMNSKPKHSFFGISVWNNSIIILELFSCHLWSQIQYMVDVWLLSKL